MSWGRLTLSMLPPKTMGIEHDNYGAVNETLSLGVRKSSALNISEINTHSGCSWACNGASIWEIDYFQMYMALWLTNFPCYVKASGRRKACLCAVVICYSVVIVCVGYFTCKMASYLSAHLIWKLECIRLDVMETIQATNKEFYESNWPYFVSCLIQGRVGRLCLLLHCRFILLWYRARSDFVGKLLTRNVKPNVRSWGFLVRRVALY